MDKQVSYMTLIGVREMRRYGPIVAFICSDYVLHTYNIMDHQRLIFLAVSLL